MIEMKNIHKAYGKHVILDKFNLRIYPQEFVVIAGESGCGKSTLLNILGLLDTFQSGSYILMGKENIKPFSKQACSILRNKIGYLFQDFALLENESVKYNLNIALENAKCKNKIKLMIDALEKVGLDEQFLEKKICECSGGEQQRISIARLFLKPCDLILADEPTGSLDSENKMLIYRLLREMQEDGKTIVVVSHDEDFIKLADRVITIKKYF